MQDNNFDLNNEKDQFQKIEAAWLEYLIDLKISKTEIINNDLFSIFEYLMKCDLFFKNCIVEIKKINEQLSRIDEIKQHLKGNELRSIIEFRNEIIQLKLKFQNNLDMMDVEYSHLSEDALGKAQNLITKFVEKKSNNLTLTGDLNQNIDPKLFLQELKDSLEAYREAREEFISESVEEILPRLDFPEKIIPEDFGEEVPQIDSILSQLDSIIMECDYALLITASSETE